MRALPLLSPLERALFLKAQPHFESLPSGVITALARHSRERFLRDGEALERSDEAPDPILFLAAGGIRLAYASGLVDDVVTPGGVGILQHLAQLPEPPDASALGETVGLEIESANFVQIMEDHFVLLLAVARTLGRLTVDLETRLGDARPPEPGFEAQHLGVTPARLDLVNRLAQTRRAPFFRGSNLSVLAELLRHEEPRRVAAGEKLWSQGDGVDGMALVLDGSFRAEGSRCSAHIPAGGMLGAWEIFTERPRAEAVVAETAGRILPIQRPLFTDVLEDHFEYAMDYLGKLARRLLEVRAAAWAQERERAAG